MSCKGMGLRLVSTGVARGEIEVASEDIDARLSLPRGTVEGKSGVAVRRFCGEGVLQGEFAARALGDALSRGGIDVGGIDLLISACGVQQQALPTTACAIGAAAGLPQGVPCMDVGASCLSFLVALRVANDMMMGGGFRRCAIVSADMPSRGLDWGEPEASWIFGDGAAAAVVELSSKPGVGIRSFGLSTYTDGLGFCEIRGGGTRVTPGPGVDGRDFLFRMEPRKVLRMAMDKVPPFVDGLMGAAGMSMRDVDVLIPHQASHLGMHGMAKRLGVGVDRMVDIYRGNGNQVAASLPTALHEAETSGRLGEGTMALLLGTAAGLSVGGLVWGM